LEEGRSEIITLQVMVEECKTMNLGVLLLLGAGILILLGLAQQVLDRLYLNDKQALLFLAAMVVGSFINIPLYRGTPPVSLNLGGAVLPVGLAVYVFSRAGSRKEVNRGIFGVALTALAVYAVSKLYFFDTYAGRVEPQYIWGILAGTVAYLVGRSRRLAFIGATLGILVADIAHAVEAGIRGLSSPARIGGAGIFDTLVLAGIIGVLLAEIIGETRERIQGGPAEEQARGEGEG